MTVPYKNSDEDDDVSDPGLSDEPESADVDSDSPAVADASTDATPASPQVSDQGQASPQAQAAPAAPAQAASQAPQTSGVLTPVSAQELKDEDAKTANDLASGQITPETYHSLFAKKDTLGKIGTIFGLLLSGAGSGLAHQPNALLDMMNNEIGRDLEAQKSSATNAQNLLRINQQNEANKAQIGLTGAQQKLAEADTNTKTYALSRMQHNQMALHSLVQLVNKYPVGSVERQNAEQQLALLSNSVQAENFDIADRAAAASALAHTAFGMNNPQGGQVAGQEPEANFQQQQSILRMSGNQALADQREARHMPGVPGMSSVALTGEDRGQITSAQQLIGSLNRLKQFSVNNPHPLPGSAADREGRALAAQVQGDFRQATHGGVFKEGEQNFINQVVPGDPTTMNPFAKVVPKINTVINETAARNLQFLKAKGFPVGGGKQEQQQAPQTQPVASLGAPVERKTPDGQIALFDSQTKKFLGYKNSNSVANTSVNSGIGTD